MKGAMVILALIFLLGCTAPQPIICTAEEKVCPDGTAVGRIGPACEFAPCPTPQTWTPNPALELPDNYLASESTIPSSANQQFETLARDEKYKRFFGATLSFCQRENSGYYSVSAGTGFAVQNYFFSAAGEDLGYYAYGDVQDPNAPLPPFDFSGFTCMQLKQSGGDNSPESIPLVEIRLVGSSQYQTIAYTTGRVVVDSADDRMDQSKMLSEEELSRLKDFVNNKEYTLWQNTAPPPGNGAIVDSYATFFVYADGARVQIDGNSEIRDLLSIPYP